MVALSRTQTFDRMPAELRDTLLAKIKSMLGWSSELPPEPRRLTGHLWVNSTLNSMHNFLSNHIQQLISDPFNHYYNHAQPRNSKQNTLRMLCNKIQCANESNSTTAFLRSIRTFIELNKELLSKEDLILAFETICRVRLPVVSEHSWSFNQGDFTYEPIDSVFTTVAASAVDNPTDTSSFSYTHTFNPSHETLVDNQILSIFGPDMPEETISIHSDLANYFLYDCLVDLNTSAEGSSPFLLTAISAGNLDLAALLIKNGARVNNKEPNPPGPRTYPIVREGTPEFTVSNIALVRTGALYERNPSEESLNMFKLLISKGADINTFTDNSHNTCLINASQNGNLPLVQYLLAHREINPHQQNSYGRTALSSVSEMIGNLTDPSTRQTYFQIASLLSEAMYNSNKVSIPVERYDLVNYEDFDLSTSAIQTP